MNGRIYVMNGNFFLLIVHIFAASIIPQIPQMSTEKICENLRKYVDKK